ncbi:MAG TPA: hypothetical protein VG603_00745 [Chitinophagales bacterium]|nr:hypothetical protein [Chitinophagales bacterium]
MATTIVVFTTMACCSSSKKQTAMQVAENISYKPPVVIIYKTRADYSKYVPVTLSDDKMSITNYPDPKDVFYNGKLAYPTALKKGFWLDNRGINANTAFIKMTYDEYSKLGSAPTAENLYKMILDKDPVTEIYNLGSRYRFKDEVSEINQLIENNSLGQFKKLK